MNWTATRRVLGALLLGVTILVFLLLVGTLIEIAHQSEAIRQEHIRNADPIVLRLCVLAWHVMLVGVPFYLIRYGRPARLGSGILLALHSIVLLFALGDWRLLFLPTNWTQAAIFYGVWGVPLVTLLDLALPPFARRT